MLQKKKYTKSNLHKNSHLVVVYYKQTTLFMSKQSTVRKELSSVLLTHFGTITRILKHIILLMLTNLSYKLRRISSPILPLSHFLNHSLHQWVQSVPAQEPNQKPEQS